MTGRWWVSLSGTYVPSAGKTPNRVLLVGEAPGKDEAHKGAPFVGRAGQEQEWYLNRRGLSARSWRRTNVVPIYTEGNPDPTPAQVRKWTPHLEAEIDECNPALVVAVGRHSVRWFLGDDVDMEAVHGIPHPSARTPAVVLPIYHPAAGFYNNDLKAVIDWDYQQVADTLHRIDNGRPVAVRHENPGGDYRYVSGEELVLALPDTDVLGIDTEGYAHKPWSIQVAWSLGEAVCLRADDPSLVAGIHALQQAIDYGALLVIHNAMHDIGVMRALGLDLSRARIWDSMYAAYLLRLEPQGLKPLAWRWCGMKMQSYKETVGHAGRDRCVEYLGRVLERDWPAPEPRAIINNDGSTRVYRPQPISRRVEGILVDVYSGKVNKDGEPTDPYARWQDVDAELREMVEEELGSMTEGDLSDIDPEVACRYACRDADAVLRLYAALRPVLEKEGLNGLMEHGMEVLPIFEEMQRTGMPASRRHFSELADRMTHEMGRIGERISREYYGGKAFNPGSNTQVGSLMRRRGLTGTKRTSTGLVSTSKPSIEYLRYKDPAIADVFEWRERQHVRDAFCRPLIARVPADVDAFVARCQILPTRVHTRRLATKNPNLLAMPVRTELGRMVRDGFRNIPGHGDGMTLGSWDLSQIEMRVMAHESQDPLLVKVFNEGLDIHNDTAARIFRIDPSEVDKYKHRIPAKNAGFGTLYGIGGHGLWIQLKMQKGIGDYWTPESCQALIDDWLKLYGGVADYINRTQRDVRRTGIVRDSWGMPRYLPGIWSNDPKTQAEAARIAVNHKIQGGAQGMIQRSMVWLAPRIEEWQRAGRHVHWCLLLHDELIFWFQEDLWDELDDLVLEALTRHHGLDISVPVEAEGRCDKSWAGLK